MTDGTKPRRPLWRRKRWLLAGVLALVIVPGAIAGTWFFYDSLVGGSGTASIQSTAPADGGAVLTIAAAASPAINPGGPATNLVVTVTNHSTQNEVITNINAPTMTDDQTLTHQNKCSGPLTFSGTALATIQGPTFAPGNTTFTFANAITAPSNLPVYCPNAVITFTFNPTGSTTNP